MGARRSAVQPRQHPRQTVSDSIDRRISELRAWLQEHAPETAEMQSHLDANTSERAYWHHGYLVALLDVRNLLQGHKDRPH